MSSSDSNSPPPPKLRNISGEASQTLQGMAGIGRGGVRLAARTGGQADEPGIREIMKGDHPKLADIGECLRDLSPGQKSKALKNYLSIAPR
jgi:hypothetical protein